MLWLQHDVFLAYSMVTLIIPAFYCAFHLFKRDGYKQFSLSHHFITLVFFIGPIINILHDMVYKSDKTTLTVASEVCMGCAMLIISGVEVYALYQFIKSTWLAITLETYESIFSSCKKAFQKHRYSKITDRYSYIELHPSLMPLSWSKWILIDLVMNWFCSQLLVSVYQMIMYFMRAASIDQFETDGLVHRQSMLSVFSAVTGVFLIILVINDMWIYRQYTYPNFLFYVTAIMYYFACLTEYFVNVSSKHIDYAAVVMMCFSLAALVMKLGVSQHIKTELIKKYIKDDKDD